MSAKGGFNTSFMLDLPSAANLREHHMARSRRAKSHRSIAAVECQRAKRLPMPLLVTLTRIAGRELDDDNLAHAFKSVRDGVADALGIKDNDPRVSWAYAQERRGVGHPNKVRIVIGPRGEA